MMSEDKKNKSKLVENEEKILEFWNKNKIFEKSLEKSSPKGEFVFYDGPPFATGSPHYGHILTSTIKDVIPRYKTMRGYHVPRRWGWDCHGLPIENIVEKELGLKSKKDIEVFGVEKFNDAARECVMRYADDWRKQVPRFGRWVDMDNDYRTMDSHYTESVWWVFKTLHDKGLIYEGYKSMHVCPRCETTLSNFEVTQGYKDITDISVFVKFKIKNEENTSFLAWTTTPWTLPGNVALAVGKDIAYAKVEIGGEYFIIAKARLEEVLKGKEYKILSERKGHELVGIEYEPLFNYYVGDENLLNRKNGWKIYSADFVTTGEGTGIVHIAPAFGEDDMKLANEHALPFVQHVSMDGRFKKEVKDFALLEVKPKSAPGLEDDDIRNHQETDIKIIKHLAHEGLLFEKKKIIHPYPHCWRCETPLLNYTTTSWFVKVTEIKNKLVKENKKINWVPKDIRDGRFGNWLLGARDWAISRSRYWGAPIPVWRGEGDRVFIPGGVKDLCEHTRAKNKYLVMRHGEAESNFENILSSGVESPHGLTSKGKEHVKSVIEKLKNNKIDVIVHSPLRRTRETAEIVAKSLGIRPNHIIKDERLREIDFGDLNGGPVSALSAYTIEGRFDRPLPGGESYHDVLRRMTKAVEALEKSYEGKTILIVTHDSPTWLLFASAQGLTKEESIKLRGTSDITSRSFINNAEILELAWKPLPRDKGGNVNLHRPYIDELAVYTKDGKPMVRVPEVFDCWFESGSMPYGEAKYLGKRSSHFDPKGGLLGHHRGFPADFIAEGLDQTRGWFYSMMVLGVGLFGKSPFKSVIVNGLVLAEDGKKMSKSLKNYPDPMDVINTYGMDAIRYYLLSSSVVVAEDLCFSEKGVDEVAKKLLQKLDNVLSFYELYFDSNKQTRFGEIDVYKFENVLDKWILARLDETVILVTKGLEKYELDKATRPLMDFVDDLSNWYLRRSRDRFRSDDVEDKNDALNTMHFVLSKLSKLLAPFCPFYAEYLYQKLRGNGLRQGASFKESVHLEIWPESNKLQVASYKLIENMKSVRKVVTMGLEQRMKMNLKVRQPLRNLKLKTKNEKFGEELLDLIKDEVNVKSVQYANIENETELDTEITGELKEEGDVRELLRAIQDLRKVKGFKVGEMVSLTIDTSGTGKMLVEKYIGEIKKGAQLRDIAFSVLIAGDDIKVGDFSAKIRMEK